MDVPQPATIALIVEGLKVLAWPAVAVLALLRYRPEIRSLLHRLREGGGAKFDPLPPGQGDTTVVSNSAALVMSFPRTPASQQLERTIRAAPDLVARTDPAQREEYLVAAMARIAVQAQFDFTEAYIFASQVALLGYLNIRPQGESANTLRQIFYDPATVQYPEMYGDYSFDNYLAFLQRTTMLTRTADLVQITEMGTEYLAWRASTGRPPRTRG